MSHIIEGSDDVQKYTYRIFFAYEALFNKVGQFRERYFCGVASSKCMLVSVYGFVFKPKTWIKNKISTYLHREWTNRWLGISEARQTKIFMPKPNPRISNKLMSYNRETCAKLFRWITGHSFHRYHNHLTNPTIYTNPACRICNYEKEETSHLFAQCPGLTPIRMKICGMATFPANHNWSPHLLLSMINEIDKICPEELTQNDRADSS
jgi:hypothetical protein